VFVGRIGSVSVFVSCDVVTGVGENIVVEGPIMILLWIGSNTLQICFLISVRWSAFAPSAISNALSHKIMQTLLGSYSFSVAMMSLRLLRTIV